MKTWFNLAYELIGGKRKSKPFTPVLEELNPSSGSEKVLIRDPSTGEIREQNLAEGDSYGFWLCRIAGVNHVVTSQMIAEFLAGSPSLSFSRTFQSDRWVFTLKNNGGVPIVDMGSHNNYDIAMNEDKLFKIHLTSPAVINLTDLKPDVSHTIILHIKATTSTFNPIHVISWKCNEADIPSICFHMDAPIGYVSAHNNYLVSITNHGGGNTDLAISYIKIKS